MKPRRKKSKKELKAEIKLGQIARSARREKSGEETKKSKITIAIPRVLTVRDLAEKLGISPEKVISELIKNGVMANINESIDFETAQIIGLELGFQIIEQKTDQERKKVSDANLKSRPPVVTIMGHVDHGKTTLIDTIRKTDVAEQESGAITQQIGAYQVEVKYKKGKRQITFLDTPGHEAFSSLRAHGANLTDIVVLVVAANDGIKPQTIEAVSHARSASVPIIVAINKTDLPDADTEKVKRQLAEINLLPEEWGGKISTVEISAKQGKNINTLLEIILLTADMEELKADYHAPAQGTIIESKILKGFGPVATVLVQQGTLKVGDIISVGSTWAKIKALIDWRGRRIKQSAVSTPVQITGLRSLPEAGEIFYWQKDEKTARQIIARSQKTFTVKSIGKKETALDVTVAKLTIKADTAGSLKAIQDKLNQIDSPTLKVDIINQGIGAINETDINLAAATQALVIGFKVSLAKNVKKLAYEKKVKVAQFDIIYDLFKFVYKHLEELLPPEIIEQPIGRAKIIKIFHQFKAQAVVGLKISQGKLEKNFGANHIRDDQTIGRVKIQSLEKEKVSASEAKTGQIAGGKLIKKEPFAKIKIGDIIEAYSIEKKKPKLIINDQL